MRYWSLIFLLAATATGQESALHADFRGEVERVNQACGTFSVKAIPTCGYELFTDHPLHIAAGSLPPQNGFGLGVAFVAAMNTKDWRMSSDVDAVGSTNASWRAGAYIKFIHTPPETIRVVLPTSETNETKKKPSKPGLRVHPYTVFNVYAQSISLNKLNFFGLGNDTTLAGASVFGTTQTIIGANAVKPVYEAPVLSRLNFAVSGEINGRFVSVPGESGQSVPSIQTLYTNATAPGLTSQPAFVQLGEGLRIRPIIEDRLELNYQGTIQQFFAPSSSDNSFLRWTVDLNHTFYLYGYTRSAPNGSGTNGPDECSLTPGTTKCAPVSSSWNRNGSIGVRLFLSESITSANSNVPFYFQQTLGGQDVNSTLALPSYQDYRFRAPNLLLLQGAFEHSLWGPFGLKFQADQGRVALTRGDVGFNHLRHSFAAGFTLRAGGFPMVYLMFAWGGPEGHHTIFNMNSSLLGGSARPSLD